MKEEFNLSEKRITDLDEHGFAYYEESWVKEFIKLRNEIEGDLFMKIMGRINAEVDDSRLINEFCRKDFIEHKKRHNKLAGDKLI